MFCFEYMITKKLQGLGTRKPHPRPQRPTLDRPHMPLPPHPPQTRLELGQMIPVQMAPLSQVTEVKPSLAGVAGRVYTNRGSMTDGGAGS